MITKPELLANVLLELLLRVTPPNRTPMASV